MLAPRKLVHLLLMISELVIIVAYISMIILFEKIPSIESNHKVWIGSKILTVNKIMKQNNYEIYPIIDINSINGIVNYSQNYMNLLKHSGKECEIHYKKCGKLDTLGNIMCIPNNHKCPINEVKVELKSKNDEYIYKGYKVASLENLNKDYSLYYTNTAIDNDIVTKLDFFDDVPTYISINNLIFDSDTYRLTLRSKSEGRDDDDFDGWDDWGDWGDNDGGVDIGSGGGAFRILEDEKVDVMDYIKSCLNNSSNIDKSFKNVFENLYVGNYIGFKDYNSMNNFMKIDLRYLYLNPFPNDASLIFDYIGIPFLFVLIICSLIRFCHKDKPNEGYNKCATLAMKLCIIIPYLIFFIGFFVYIIYHFCAIYNRNKFNDLKNIIADEYLEVIIAEVKNQHNKMIYHLIVIILFCLAMIIFVVGWILNIIYTKRYLDRIIIAQKGNSFDKSSI